MPTFVAGQTLPDVTGMTAADAADALAFVLAVPLFLDSVVNAAVGAGRVVSQSPAAGIDITERLTVTLAMSSGDGSLWKILVTRRLGA